MDSDETGSPFTRPAFLISAGLVVVLAAAAIVLGLTRHHGSDDNARPAAIPTATSSGPASPVRSGTSARSDESVCGLASGAGPETVASPPAVNWKFQGTTAYPTSPTVGPGKTAEAGYRYCFQHSAAGALLFAANAVAQNTDDAQGRAWYKYAFSSGGPYEAEVLSQAPKPGELDAVQRVSIAGYRLLSYDDTAAAVDLAVRITTGNKTTLTSSTSQLRWHDGDWKFSTDVAKPGDAAVIPDLTGYTAWGES